MNEILPEKILAPQNPFPGIRPFEPEEAFLFYGREKQTDELLRRLKTTRFLSVIGTSGSGKSSLVRAGLLPALHGGFMPTTGSSWHIAIMRPGDDPIGNLAAALLEPEALGTFIGLQKGSQWIQLSMVESTLRRSAIGLVEATKHANFDPNKNLLIVVDQFEELFRFKERMKESNEKEEAFAFVKLLIEASKQIEVPIFIVITMRSDFLGDCAQFRELPETLNDGQFLIPRMTRDQRQQAIEAPIAVSGRKIAAALTQQLLNDVGDDPDQLPILQHALMRTWNHHIKYQKQGNTIDFEDYYAVGGMDDALSQHAEEVYNDLPDLSGKKNAEKLFKCLTEKGANSREIRRPTTILQIATIANTTVDQIIFIIEHFRKPGRSFFMPTPPNRLAADTLIDISHESLIRRWETLKNWVDEEAESVTTYKRLLETARLWKAGKENLLGSLALKHAQFWEESVQPNQEWASRYGGDYDWVKELLQESREKRNDTIDRLADQIDWYDRKSLWNQFFYKRLQLTEIIAAALVPLFAGFPLIPASNFFIGALGVIIIVLMLVQHSNQYQQNWTTYRATCEALKQEKFLWSAKAGPYADNPDADSLLSERVESILSPNNIGIPSYSPAKTSGKPGFKSNIEFTNPTLERLDDQISWYGSKGISSQHAFKRLKLSEILAAASLPLLASIPVSPIILGGLGILLVIFEGLQHLFQYQHNATSYRSTCEALKHEKYLWLAKAGPYDDNPKADVLLAERVESLISQEHAKWISTSTREEAIKSSEY